MSSGYASLEVQPPEGKNYTISLTDKNRFTLGRSNKNDIVLPNPQKTISRQHCILECEANFWWVVDDRSANGTFVQHGNSHTRINVRDYGRLQLNNGDVILILAQPVQPDEPIFWRITFQNEESY